MTPSAACGILEANDPEAGVLVAREGDRGAVLRPLSRFSIPRNEVKSKASDRSARSWQDHGGGFFADEDRSQRHTLALRDVAYAIRARMSSSWWTARITRKNIATSFTDGLPGGRGSHRPYLGGREFAASFGEPDPAKVPIDLSEDLGLMLFDLDYAPDGSGRGKPSSLRPA